MRLPPMWLVFDSGPVAYVGGVCVVSPVTPLFLPLKNPTSPNSDSTMIADPHENKLRLTWLPL